MNSIDCYVFSNPRVQHKSFNEQTMKNWLSGVCGHSNKHASGHIPEAQCAFKDLMIHEDMQFALRIAFRCVLHRCGNQDIRCWKSYGICVICEGEMNHRLRCFIPTPSFLKVNVVILFLVLWLKQGRKAWACALFLSLLQEIHINIRFHSHWSWRSWLSDNILAERQCTLQLCHPSALW